MQNQITLVKKIAIYAIVVINIFVLGAVFGAYQWNQYVKHNDAKVKAAVEEALKATPTPSTQQAASKK